MDSKIVRCQCQIYSVLFLIKLAAITLVKGKLEETELPLKEYDIIISEWMGYFLLYESMLDTVLDARDKYLAKDGLIFPDTATMYIAAIEDQEYKDEKINFWDSVYGFDYSCIKDIALREPLVDTVDLKAVVSDPYMFKKIDLLTAKKEDLTFDVPFELEATRDDYAHAFLAWFDISFECTHKHVKFSTGPHAQYTHWKQTVFYTPDTLTVTKGDKITGRLTCAPNKRNPRDLDIKIAYKHRDEEATIEYKMCVHVFLWPFHLLLPRSFLPSFVFLVNAESERILIVIGHNLLCPPHSTLAQPQPTKKRAVVYPTPQQVLKCTATSDMMLCICLSWNLDAQCCTFTCLERGLSRLVPLSLRQVNCVFYWSRRVSHPPDDASI